MRDTMTIGLTGGYGSGKSTVSGMLKKLGCAVIDADVIARDAVRQGSPSWKKIRACFGDSIFRKSGAIDRKKLAGIVFSDQKKLRFLNSVIHPVVIKNIKKKIKEIKADGKKRIIVVSAPLLIEAGMAPLFDRIIVIKLKKEVQLKRCMSFKKEKLPDIRKRIASQMPAAQKLKYADYVIDNNGTVSGTRKQIVSIADQINKEINKL